MPLMVQRVRLVEYQSANAPSLSHGCSTDGKQRTDRKEPLLSFRYPWRRLLEFELILNCLCAVSLVVGKQSNDCSKESAQAKLVIGQTDPTNLWRLAM